MTGASQIMQNVFGTAIFRNLLNQQRYIVIFKKNIQALLSFNDNIMKFEDNLIVWEKDKEVYL